MPHVHLSEIELVELVEGELDETAEAAASAHVEQCATCRDQLALLETGRSALRASAVLELAESRAEGMLTSLPSQEREPGRLASLLHSPRRLALALAPVAAIVAAVVGITVATGGGSDRQAGTAAPASTVSAMDAQAAEAAPADGAAESPSGGAAADEGPSLENASTASAEKGPPPTGPFRVAGPVSEVARLLEAAGFEVSVSGQTITVSGADPAAVARALDGRSTGDVEVVVETAG